MAITQNLQHGKLQSILTTKAQALNRGIVATGNAIQAGRFTEAEAMCKQLLQVHPNSPDVFNLLGMIEIGRKRHLGAAHYFSKAVEIQPDCISYLNNMGRAFLDCDRPELALPPLVRALTLDPKQPEALSTIAKFYRAIGKAELALPYFEKAIAVQSKDFDLRLEYAYCLDGAGHFEKARAEFTILKRSKKHRSRALSSIARSSDRKLGLDTLLEIRSALSDPSVSQHSARDLHYAAGKILEDNGRYDEAFVQFEEAKKLKAAEFDWVLHARQFESTMELFVRGFFEARQKFGNLSEVPTFVVGMPRSGTTLTEQIIASHPSAAGAGEQKRIRQMASSMGYKRDVDEFCTKVSKLDAAEIEVLSSNYLGLLNLFSGTAERIVDKMPHNFTMLGLIALLFPNARIVHCHRDPLDTCVSCYTNHFNRFHSYTNDLQTLGSYYRDYHKLMQHWREHLPLRIYHLEYERLTQDPESEVRKLVAFLDLPWDNLCLAFNERRANVSTLSQWQVRQPMYTSSVNRWKRFEKHLGPLIEALGDLAVVN
jgi:tetratricopeptide (TPR) repeat protein